MSGTYGTEQETIADSPDLDAAARLRTSQSDLTEYFFFSNSAHPLFIQNVVTGSGTAALNTNTSSLRLTTTTSSTDSVITQTKRYTRYALGMSHLVTLGLNLGAKKVNTRQRAGYFDVSNGFFFQQDSTNLAIVTRTNTSGSPVDTAVVQSSWNLDKLDGTGSSGINLDTSKYNLYIIDFGTGRIRFGIQYSGAIVYCHQVLFNNSIATPSTRSPSLPCRVELTNTGTVASTTTLDLVCLTVQKETIDSLGTVYAFSQATGRTSFSVGSTTLPLISIRPKATFNGITNRVPIAPAGISLTSTSQTVLVSLVLNATLTGATFNSADTNSAVEFDIASTAMSGGTVIKQFYVTSSSSLIGGNISGQGDSAIRSLILGLDLAGTTADILTVAAISTAGGTSAFAQIDWQEFQ